MGESGELRELSEHPTVEEVIDSIGVGRTQWVLLIITGLSFTSNAAEITFLSFVTEQLRCEWALTSAQETSIAQAVFCGMMVGAPMWGYSADKIGRRPIFLYSAAIIGTFGLATAFAQDFYSLLAIRAFVGFGVSGLPVAFVIVAESLPGSGRGAFLLYIEYFWTLGSIYVNVCAYLTLQSAGWRVFTVLAALPTFIASIAGFLVLPESPRWLIEQRRTEDALVILNNWSRRNGHEEQFRGVACEHETHHEGGVMTLFTNRKLRKTTLLMTVVWFGTGMSYYGILSWLPRIFQSMEADSSRRLGGEQTCTAGFNFMDIGASALMEVFGVLIALALIDSTGRTWTQFVFFGLGAAMSVVLGFRSLNMNILAAAAGVARLAKMAATCTMWVHTPELFPTQVRAEAQGVLNLICQIGAVLAQFLVSDSVSPVTCGVVIGAISLAAGIAALLSPETAGNVLKDDVSESSCNDIDDDDDDAAICGGAIAT